MKCVNTSHGSRASMACLAFACAALESLPAHAQDPVSAAELLLRDATALAAAGRWKEACVKFAERQKLEPTPVTLLDLASCHEQEGKTATAWSEFLSAERLASDQRRDAEAQTAKQRASALEPRLSYLTVNVGAAPAGLDVRRAGVSVPINQPVPLDPGRHEITATAPGYQTYVVQVAIETDGSKLQLDLPNLRPGAPPATAHASSAQAAPRSVPLAASEAHSGLPLGAYVLGGVGVAFLATGTAFGIVALGKNADIEETCPDLRCTPENAGAARELQDERDTAAVIANVGIFAGLTSLGVAAYVALWPTRTSDDQQSRLQIRPIVGTEGAGLIGRARF